MRNTDKDTLRQAAKVAEEQTDKVVAESVERIRQRNKKRNREEHGCPNCAASECYPSCPRYLNTEAGAFWDWWLRTNPSRMRVKEHLPLNGPPKKKGGSKSGRKRKKPPKFYKNPYLEV